MEAYEVVQRLAATAAKTEKEQILLDAYMAGQHEFFYGAKLAYDSLISFGVANVPSIEASDLNPDDPGTLTWAAFSGLAQKLARGELTGHAARDAIRDAASRCHGPSWNDFYRRVLLRDLSCGVTEKTINAALARIKGDEAAEKLMVPVFACQLAEDGMVPVHAKKLRGRKMLDVKLDGARLLTVINVRTREIVQHTREGRINANFPEIREALAPLLDAFPFSFVLDGEVVSTNFQDLMKQINSKKKVDTSNARLAVFDLIPFEEFRCGVCHIRQADRHEALAVLQVSSLLRTGQDGRAYVVPKQYVDLDTEAGQAAFKKFNLEALEAGYEGVMVKDPEAPYQCRRNAAWLKIKPVISLTMEVIGTEQGKPDGKRRDVLGALVCRTTLDDGRVVVSKCGSGIKDEQLIDFWTRREELLGLMVEIEADKITQESGSDVFSLRFPRFKGFRGHEPGEVI